MFFACPIAWGRDLDGLFYAGQAPMKFIGRLIDPPDYRFTRPAGCPSADGPADELTLAGTVIVTASAIATISPRTSNRPGSPDPPRYRCGEAQVRPSTQAEPLF
jgi:hypothetical protein